MEKMAAQVRVSFGEVRDVFLRQNPDPGFRSTAYALRLLEAADRRFGAWFVVVLSLEETNRGQTGRSPFLTATNWRQSRLSPHSPHIRPAAVDCGFSSGGGSGAAGGVVLEYGGGINRGQTGAVRPSVSTFSQRRLERRTGRGEMSSGRYFVAPGHDFEFGLDGVHDWNHRPRLHGKGGEHRAELVNRQGIVALHQQMPAPIAYPHHEELDFEILWRLPLAKHLQDSFLCSLILRRRPLRAFVPADHVFHRISLASRLNR